MNRIHMAGQMTGHGKLATTLWTTKRLSFSHLMSPSIKIDNSVKFLDLRHSQKRRRIAGNGTPGQLNSKVMPGLLQKDYYKCIHVCQIYDCIPIQIGRAD